MRTGFDFVNGEPLRLRLEYGIGIYLDGRISGLTGCGQSFFNPPAADEGLIPRSLNLYELIWPNRHMQWQVLISQIH